MNPLVVAILMFAQPQAGLGVSYSQTMRTVQADVDVLGHFGFQGGVGQDLVHDTYNYQLGTRLYVRRSRFFSPYVGALYTAELDSGVAQHAGATAGLMIRRKRGPGVYAQVAYLKDLRTSEPVFNRSYGIGLQWWF